MSGIVDKAMAAVYSPEFLKHHQDQVELHKRITVSSNPQSYAEACRALVRFDMTRDLERIKRPTLIVAGELDQVTPVSDSVTLNARIEDSLMKVLPNCGHMVHIEKPQIFNAVVDKFCLLYTSPSPRD